MTHLRNQSCAIRNTVQQRTLNISKIREHSIPKITHSFTLRDLVRLAPPNSVLSHSPPSQDSPKPASAILSTTPSRGNADSPPRSNTTVSNRCCSALPSLDASTSASFSPAASALSSPSDPVPGQLIQPPVDPDL